MSRNHVLHHLRACAIPLLLLAFQPAAALAQACTGFAPLDDTRYRASAGIANYRYATGYSASLTAGRPLHATATFQWVNDEELEASSYRTTVEGGVTWSPLNDALSICPVVGLTYATVPFRTLRYGEGVGFRDISVSGGLDAAILVRLNERVSILPAGTVRVIRMWGRRITQCGTINNRCHEPGHNVYWVVGGGVGFALNDRITIRPGVTVPLDFPPALRGDWLVPFGREENEIALELSVGFNFGSRGRGTGGDR